MILDQNELSVFSKLISFPKDIVIVSHRNPDGDAIGSSLAISAYLQSLSHRTHVIFPSEYPEVFEWMPGAKDIVVYDLQAQLTEDLIKNTELIICLDFNSLERIDKMGLMVAASTAQKMMIDHHLDPEPFADIQFSVIESSSTAEIIYEILKSLSPNSVKNPIILDCLYTGIVTDTGSFHHATSENLFRIMAEMKEAGLNDTLIQELVHNSLPDKYLKLLGHCLYNRMELISEWNLGIIHLTREDYRLFDIRRGDTEGIINYLMMLKSVRVGILIMNQPSIVKLSMRSKGSFSVQAICKEHFNGGGHRNASGGYWKKSLDEAILKIKEVFPKYIAPVEIEN
ncbi:MAG: DHH family phosphoesterase [Saprospiraceae bacterium]|nr:DHH family phosphoesterase [Saprospiraceae bacterium]